MKRAKALPRTRQCRTPSTLIRRTLAVAGLCGVVLTLGASKPSHASTTLDLSASLARCAQIGEASERLACFDGLAARDAPAAPPPETVATQPIEPTGTAPPSRPMTASSAPPGREEQGMKGVKDERRFLGVRLYRPNYLLPFTYNDNPNRNVPGTEGLDIPFLGDALDNVEMKFQVSVEVPVWTQILDQDLDLYFAYTQLAFFQAYNREYSSPFRETNYEPELGLNWQPDISAFGWRVRSMRAMLNHQSNGRSEPLSRSWNRLVGQLEAERGDMSLALRVWSPLETSPSDNPDIYEYLGYGELHAAYDLEKHHFAVMLRNPAHPSIQLDWTYAVGDTIRLYLQYYNGYGESLLDYDHSVNRIGIGFLVNEWP